MLPSKAMFRKNQNYQLRDHVENVDVAEALVKLEMGAYFKVVPKEAVKEEPQCKV